LFFSSKLDPQKCGPALSEIKPSFGEGFIFDNGRMK